MSDGEQEVINQSLNLLIQTAEEENDDGDDRQENAKGADAGNDNTADDDGDGIPGLNLEDILGGDSSRSSSKKPSGSKVEWADAAVSEENLEASIVIVAKNARGAEGSRDYLRYFDAATTPLDPKVGVPSHFISSCDGEAESGNQSKAQYIQQAFVSSIEKVEQAKLRAEQYDMMAIFLVPAVRDKNAKKPNKIFDMDSVPTDMFTSWDSLDWKHVCLWQKTINVWGKSDDKVSSKWAQSFLYKSSTTDLRDRVNTQYKRLLIACRGAVTYLYLQLRIMFYMSRDTINALKKYLKLWEEKGLRRIRGENVVIAEKEIIAVCTRLHEVNSLPDETVADILEGLTNCSVPEFTKMFDWQLQGIKVRSLKLEEDNMEGDTLEMVKEILTEAVDAYHALCTAGKWHVNNKRASLVICWNCGEEGHRCEKCTKPVNQSNIDAAKKKWQNSKGSGGDPSGSGGGGKHTQQQRKKWGHSEAPKDGGCVCWFNGTPMAWCGKKDSLGKQCGWNKDHSTNYHSWKMDNPSSLSWLISPQGILSCRRRAIVKAMELVVVLVRLLFQEEATRFFSASLRQTMSSPSSNAMPPVKRPPRLSELSAISCV
jgi:hypothetical protein